MIVVATEEEYKLAQQRFNDKIIKTGVGALNVINKLKDLDRNAPIINFGYVGSNNIKVGTEMQIAKSKLYHPNVEYKEQEYKLESTGTTCYTSNDFVLNTDIKEPVVFDMELAYIMALGFKNVKSIKIVSDNLSLKEYEEEIK
jgi:hypothetical protein